MYLEALTICKDYSDFLAVALYANRSHFNRLLVVTSADDKDTHRVCEFYHVECVDYDGFGDEFNKAGAINFGLSKLSRRDWVIHMDADIMLPPRTRQLLEAVTLDPKGLYGIDRMNVTGAPAIFDLIVNPKPVFTNEVFLFPSNGFELSPRIVQRHRGGYLPIGFFQMWHPTGSQIAGYPETHTTAARTDMQFALQWERKNRHLLPEITCWHLESEKAEMGANWKGRATKRLTLDG